MIIYKIKNRYSLLEKLHLLLRLIHTRLYYPEQRIIRKNFEIRGKDMVSFGRGLTTGVGCRIEAFISDGNKEKKLFIGDNVQLNDYVHISSICSVEIGDDVLMASHVYISDNTHGCYKGKYDNTSPNIPPIKRPYYASPVKIGSRVWLGEGVIILPGVTIGDGAIIGAHSIVNHNIPSNCMAVGTPAKIIKVWNSESKHWEKHSL